MANPIVIDEDALEKTYRDLADATDAAARGGRCRRRLTSVVSQDGPNEYASKVTQIPTQRLHA